MNEDARGAAMLIVAVELESFEEVSLVNSMDNGVINIVDGRTHGARCK